MLSKQHPVYNRIVEYCDGYFNQHGAVPRGVNWPNETDAVRRLKIMKELWSNDTRNSLDVLDLGCGYGAFLGYLLKTAGQKKFVYTGIDLSIPMIDAARESYQEYIFLRQDILREPLEKESFDYGVMNGVLTAKLDLSFEEMEKFAHDIIFALYQACRYGISFNVMSSHVDWERSDLFHLPVDRLLSFLVKNCSRHVIVRADYGVYDYTVYVYRNPNLSL